MKKVKTETEAKEKMNPKKKKKIIKRSIIAGVLVLVIGGGVLFSVTAKNAKMPVTTIKIGVGDIEQTLNTSGNVKSEISKTYFPPAEVAIEDLQVSLGEAVKEGDKLLGYNTKIVEFNKSKAELQENANKNGLMDSVSESTKQQDKYNQAVMYIATVEPMIVSQKEYINNIETYLEDKNSKEKVKLYNEQYSIQKEINYLNEEAKREATDGVVHGLAKLNNQLEAINFDLKLMEEDAETTEIERNIIKEKNKLTDLEDFLKKQEALRDGSENQVLSGYDVEKLKAENELAQLEADKAVKDLEEVLNGVTADFDGIITELGVEEGALATQSTKVLKLESSKNVKITFSVSKYDLEKIKVGQKADVTISGYSYQGTLSKINRMATTNSAGSQVVEAEVHIDNPDDNIYLGVEGKVNIHTATVSNAIILPVELVNADQDGDFCFVVENEMIAKRRIVTGISSDSMIEVKEGLKEGDEVVSPVGMGITEGLPVTVLRDESTSVEVSTE